MPGEVDRSSGVSCGASNCCLKLITNHDIQKARYAGRQHAHTYQTMQLTNAASALRSFCHHYQHSFMVSSSSGRKSSAQSFPKVLDSGAEEFDLWGLEVVSIRQAVRYLLSCIRCWKEKIAKTRRVDRNHQNSGYISSICTGNLLLLRRPLPSLQPEIEYSKHQTKNPR
jgi:hypothetical protein